MNEKEWGRNGPWGDKFDRMWGDSKDWSQEQRVYFRLMLERRMVVGHTICFALSIAFLMKGRRHYF